MAIIKRLGKYGVQVYRNGSRDWIGTFPSYREAKQAERDALADNTPRARETCEQFALRWPEEFNHVRSDGSLRWSPQHQQNLRLALRPFIEEFGSESISRFPTARALPWASTRKHFTVKFVRAMFNDAVKSGLCDSNPFANLGLERSRGRADILAITEEELHLLAGCALDEGKTLQHGSVMKAAILFTGYVGVRSIGLRNIRAEDVDLEARTVRVRKPGKKVAPRTIFLPDPAAEAVAKLIDRTDPTDWLFTAVQGGKLTKANLFYAWDPIRREFDRRLDPRRAQELRESRPRETRMQFHELRHCACTIMARRGVDPQTASWQLCQTDGGELVKRVYSHLTDQERHGFLKQAFSDQPVPDKLREAANG